jgi:hypothetical protein
MSFSKANKQEIYLIFHNTALSLDFEPSCGTINVNDLDSYGDCFELIITIKNHLEDSSVDIRIDFKVDEWHLTMDNYYVIGKKHSLIKGFSDIQEDLITVLSVIL